MPHKDPEVARTYFRERARRRRELDPTPFLESGRRHYAKHRERYLANYSPEKARNYRLVREYGITAEEWDRLFDSQSRCCAVCRTNEPGTAKGWHTDHDHSTKVVRGILCKSCNTTIGQLGDAHASVAERTRAILEYLREK